MKCSFVRSILVYITDKEYIKYRKIDLKEIGEKRRQKKREEWVGKQHL